MDPRARRLQVSGQVLYEPGRPQVHAYFPTSAIVALSHVLESGVCAEVAMVGDEGVVGTSVFLGGGTTISHGSVLIAGEGFRIGAQIAQTAACNRCHTIDQQLCGWLMYSLDRLRGSEVVVTQEVLASMLGVRRESVTQAAGRLQAAGLIHCARGRIAVLDCGALERRGCKCHAVVKKEYDRLLPQDPAALQRCAVVRRAREHELAHLARPLLPVLRGLMQRTARDQPTHAGLWRRRQLVHALLSTHTFRPHGSVD